MKIELERIFAGIIVGQVANLPGKLAICPTAE